MEIVKRKLLEFNEQNTKLGVIQRTCTGSHENSFAVKCSEHVIGKWLVAREQLVGVDLRS